MLLDDAERRRHDRLRREVDRARFAVGRRVLRHAVAERHGVAARTIEVRTAPAPALAGAGAGGGRPVVPGGPRGISIAHGGQLVLVALCDVHAVGVDVEPLASSASIEAVATTLLGPAEHAALRARTDPELGTGCSRQLELLRAWTRKEAILKAVGVGLTVPPEAIVLARDGAPRVAATSGGLPEARRFALWDLDAGPGHVAALAVLRDG